MVRMIADSRDPEVRRVDPRWALALSLGVIGLAALACVAVERRELWRARDAYHTCAQTQVDPPTNCAGLEARWRAAQERYERNARQAWGCDPAQAECPTPR